ncbi:MAG: glycosyltransferase [Proteobacteria bacterium]|nr:glycosyltransferase [Pseudomonadota bacterium]
MSQASSKRICIVTPDIIGPIRNGGIGTHAYHLSNALVKAGHAVTVVFTGPVEHEDEAHWVKVYAERGITFEVINERNNSSLVSDADWFIKRSLIIFWHLRGKDFDYIHFQDWQANGFCCIQAKRSTEYFQNTTLTVTMHSSTDWINEGMCKWNDWPLPDTKLSWCERYCCEHADIILSPSQYMCKYTEESGWSLAENRKIIPYCFDVDDLPVPYSPEPGVFAFFGRLETRKGLEIFLGSLMRLSLEEKNKLQKVFFFGKNGKITGSDFDGVEFINNSLKGACIKYEIAENLSAFDALNAIRERRAIAVMPSLLDNFPFTVIECLAYGIPMIAASTGGIPEMLEEDCLFGASERELCAKISGILAGRLPSFRSKYSPPRAKNLWLSLHDSPPLSGRRTEAISKLKNQSPLVSVCIPYFNCGSYIDATIQALKEQAYPNFEVIIVNDGSTDILSVQKFDELVQNNSDPRFNFFSKENGGVGAARNFAAKKAKGSFLLFCDADNVSMPDMIGEFVAAAFQTGADIVSSYFAAFDQEIERPGNETPIRYRYLPIGAALEAGIIQNVFGDANSLFRRAAFEAVGGFQEERHTSWEDWDLHVRCILSGFRLEVCPKELFWYRHTDAGFSRNTNLYHNQLRVLRAYADHCPPFMRPLLKNLLLPYHFGFVRQHEQANSLTKHPGQPAIGASMWALLTERIRRWLAGL